MINQVFRFWHQIADALVKYAKDKAFDLSSNTDLLDLHRDLIRPLATRLNPIKYALVSISVSRQFADVEEAISFLETCSKQLDGKRDAQFLLKIATAEKRLNLGQHHDCLEIVTSVKHETEQLSDIDPKVYAMQAEVFAAYYRRKEDYENYYKFGLQFLAYTPATDLTVDEHKQWATRMGMAVLLGRHIFNISELVSVVSCMLKQLVGQTNPSEPRGH